MFFSFTSIIILFSIIFTIINECGFRMHLITYKEIFRLYEKIRKRFFDEKYRELNKNHELKNRELNENN